MRQDFFFCVFLMMFFEIHLFVFVYYRITAIDDVFPSNDNTQSCYL